MKRILVCMLVLLMIFTLGVNSAFTATIGGTNLYEDKFKEFIRHDEYDDPQYECYNEMFYHKSQNDETDWALINAVGEAVPGISHAIFGEIVISDSPSCYPFGVALAVYDVKENAFYGMDEAWDMDFDDLHQAFYEVMSSEEVPYYSGGDVNILGDADEDGELSIIDATHIQRHLAKIEVLDDNLGFDHSGLVYGPNIKYLSDFDTDGDRTIADATKIQRRLAKLD